MNTNTIRLYDMDSYCKSFDAVVLKSEERKGKYFVELDATAFFPEGGGQAADTGTLNDAQVLDVQEKDGRIWHTVDRDIPCGSNVHGEIDWKKRFERMQNHSGEHILSGLLHRVHGLNNVGFHMGENITLDVDGILGWEELSEIELMANEVVYGNAAITACYPSDEELAKMSYRSKLDNLERTRIVTIEGCDRCACCAPHVARTGEIGIIKIVDFSYIRKCTRVFFCCGSLALEDYRRKHSINKEIMGLLSAKTYETAEKVKQLQQSFSEAKGTVQRLSEEKALLGLGEIFTSPCGYSYAFTGSLASGDIVFCLNHCRENGRENMAIFSGDDNSGYRFAVGSADSALHERLKAMIKELGGRGGGSDSFFQGQIKSGKDTIAQHINRL